MVHKRNYMKALWQPLFGSQTSSLLTFRGKCQVFSLGKEKLQCIRSQVLTQSYRRAWLPRDPNHPWLGCLSKQKRALGLLWKFGSPIVTTHMARFNGEICHKHVTEISTARTQSGGCLGSSTEAWMAHTSCIAKLAIKGRKQYLSYKLQRLVGRI